MSGQISRVLRCYSCRTYQVHLEKKSKTWICKVCNEKQSVKKVYMYGSGVECRQLVQKFNMARGIVLDANMRGQTSQTGSTQSIYGASDQNMQGALDQSMQRADAQSMEGAHGQSMQGASHQNMKGVHYQAMQAVEAQSMQGASADSIYGAHKNKLAVPQRVANPAGIDVAALIGNRPRAGCDLTVFECPSPVPKPPPSLIRQPLIPKQPKLPERKSKWDVYMPPKKVAKKRASPPLARYIAVPTENLVKTDADELGTPNLPAFQHDCTSN